VKWCSWRACEGGREGEKERASDISDAFNQRGGQQGKETGVLGGVRMEDRDGWIEGDHGTAVGGWHRPVADGRGRAVHTLATWC
jgi:hypothetical protein